MDEWIVVLANGGLLTLAVAITGFLLAMVIGGLGSWAKVSNQRWAAWSALVYTSFVRGVPNLILIFLVYYTSSNILTNLNGVFGGHGFVGIPLFVAGTLALGISGGALSIEILRGAYLAVDTGQIRAGKAFGMSSYSLATRIIFPQTLRHALPSLGNVWQTLLKESTLLSIIGLTELLHSSQLAANRTGRPFIYYVIAIVMYLAITAFSGIFWRYADARYAERSDSAYV